jgi:hypothetical protein
MRNRFGLLLGILIAGGIAVPAIVARYRQAAVPPAPQVVAKIPPPARVWPARRSAQGKDEAAPVHPFIAGSESRAELSRLRSMPSLAPRKPARSTNLIGQGADGKTATAETPATPPPANDPGELQAPEARVALMFVGEDEEAEAVWNDAINDPSLSPQERKDLIEDLNEEGFPDPKNLTEDDLPLILSRLALIEELAPEAMDDTNAAAFAEAYKDLSNMLERLNREQQPPPQ